MFIGRKKSYNSVQIHLYIPSKLKYVAIQENHNIDITLIFVDVTQHRTLFYKKDIIIIKKENPSKKWNVFLSEFAATAPVPGIRDGTLLMAFADIRQVHILFI